MERDSFDAWGFRRTTDWQAQRPIGSTSIVSRGFTDHEELDSLGLVNMNGRIYDPGIGRFLSADPYVQAPTQTQNFNRYSYVLNNPLSFTDPSGFSLLSDILTGFGARLIGMLPASIRPIVIGVIAVAVVLTFQYYVMPAVIAALAPSLTGLGAVVIAAAGAGFAGGFTSTILAGGSLGQAFVAGAIAGGTAALTAGVIGPMFHGIDATKPLGFFEKSLGHGLTGGLLNAAEQKLEHGSFRDGFLAGFVSGLASIGIDKVGVGQGQLGIAERTVLSAAVGGTAAELGGGKFANGAITGAFLRLYNGEHWVTPQYTDGHVYKYSDSFGSGTFQTVGAQSTPTALEVDGTAGWDTAEQAAKVAVDSSWSFSGGNEWAGAVFQNPDGSWGYTIAWSNSNNGFHSWPGPLAINGSAASALWHIHPINAPDNAYFSAKDVWFATYIHGNTYMGSLDGFINVHGPDPSVNPYSRIPYPADRAVAGPGFGRY